MLSTPSQASLPGACLLSPHCPQPGLGQLWLPEVLPVISSSPAFFLGRVSDHIILPKNLQELPVACSMTMKLPTTEKTVFHNPALTTFPTQSSNMSVSAAPYFRPSSSFSLFQIQRTLLPSTSRFQSFKWPHVGCDSIACCLHLQKNLEGMEGFPRMRHHWQLLLCHHAEGPPCSSSKILN